MAKIVQAAGWAAGGLAALALLGFGALVGAARSVGAPASLGVNNGRLAACPASPNCVSTQADPGDTIHYMEPISYRGAAGEAIERINELVLAERNSEIVVVQKDYLHAVFRSPTVGFPDDVEFYVDPQAGLIHFRSASRLGQGDLGVNRARMEKLGAQLATVLNP
jgi:uncharacterized protein (DUF1499 family)